MSMHPGRPVLRAAAVAATAVLLALSGAAVAAAAPSNTIDANEPRSLTIHKHEQSSTNPAGSAGDGGEVTIPAGNPPIAGVVFEISRIASTGGTPLDLATNAGWTTLQSLSSGFTPTSSANNYGLGAGVTFDTTRSGTTDANGEIVFSSTDAAGLPVGAYLVREVSGPAGISPAVPFIVTVPITDAATSDVWKYDVHVYPKNSVVEQPTKAVVDADTHAVGEDVTWTVTTDIPDAVGTDPTINPIVGYHVVDVFDPRLTFVPAQTVVSTVCPAAIATDPDVVTPIAAGLYTVAQAAVAAGNQVTVDFTAAGDDFLEQNRACQLTFAFVTTVNTTATDLDANANAGIISNTATLFTGDAAVGFETNAVEVRFGTYRINKLDESGDPLAGAQFSVFLTEADARAGTNPVEVDGETVFTSDATGVVSITGLRYSGFVNGASVTEPAAGDAANGFQRYWIAEVVAPDGYELLAAPQSFLVDSQDGGTGTDITNVVKNAGFVLPFTGGTGSIVLVVIGSLLVVGGVIALIVRARRAQAKA
ncbi:SpaH/EbpB family LPXTG-anchored major pilin [Microbacterium sp.]|uniref:SpaH/EbpB family LPXTG-anchored major pilin n=1 Tax=Microbacterium sp. TaxID=51671 RepID=UPI0039E67626